MQLIFLVFWVWFASLFICCIQKKNIKLIREFSLFSSIIALLCATSLFFNFERLNLIYQHTYTFCSGTNIEVLISLDGLSICFITLVSFIFPICFLSSWSICFKVKELTICLMLIYSILILVFISLNIVIFFFFFECTLIPMFIIIGLWGARYKKIKAAYYFFLYTLAGSLFMLFSILYIQNLTGSVILIELFEFNFTLYEEQILWVCFFFAFAIKVPMLPFHIWLPEAHVEAPTIGSVILASLLLKLGSYGFLRFSISLFPAASIYFTPLIYILSVTSIVYASMTAIRQIDLKRIIAYSSVAHMNIMILGLFSFNQIGIVGAIYLMVAHGIVSAALFFCVGVVYDRYHTRLIRYYGGLVQVMPVFALVFFIFTIANMSFPGTSNFIGELLIFIGLLQANPVILIFSIFGVVLSATYSVWLFNRVVFGTLKIKYITMFIDLSRVEIFIFIPLIISMLILGLNSYILTAIL